MFVGTNRIRVKTGSGKELERRFQTRGGIETQPGFLGFEMWRLERDEDFEEYLIVTHWESKDAQRAWVKSDAFKQAHSGPSADYFLGHARFRGYDVRLSSVPGREKAAV